MAAPKDKGALLVLALLGLGIALAVGSSVVGDGGGGDGGGDGGESGQGYDVDYREKSKDIKYKEGGGYGKAAGQVKRTYSSPRNMEKVKGITVHHVGVGTVGDGAIHKFTYHVVVHHDGKVYWLHPFNVRLLHGGLLNTDTIGISVSGSFGDVDDEMPPEQAAGLRRAIAWVKRQANEEGADIQKIWTHRQASANRGYDPGRSPYREGVLWAQSTLGLEHDPTETRGSGLEIPDKWLVETAASVDPGVGARSFAPRTGTQAFAWAEPGGDFADLEGEDELIDLVV